MLFGPFSFLRIHTQSGVLTSCLSNPKFWFYLTASMKILVCIVSLFIMAREGQSQAVVPPNIRATNTLEKLFDYNGIDEGDILYGIPLPEGKVVGDTYMDTHWRMANVMLYDKEKLIEGFPMRYDIHLDELEFRGKNGIKVLAGSKVKSFVWADSITRTPAYFINGKSFRNEDDVPFTGFFEVLEEGSVPLLKKTYISVRKADYNVAMNVGSRDDKILKKSKFYVLKQTRIIELPKSRKKFLALFNDKSSQLEAFIKENNLLTYIEQDLEMILDYFNSLNLTAPQQ